MKILKQESFLDLHINNAPDDHVAIWGGDYQNDLNIVKIERALLPDLIKTLQEIHEKGTKLKFKNTLFR
jgi:hypothetical protein